MLLVIGSVRHSPGASTLALAFAAAIGSSAGLISADPDGCDWPATLGCGADVGISVLSLAARRGTLSADDLVAASNATGAGCRFIPGPIGGDEASLALGILASPLATLLRRDRERTWVVDVGRLSVRSPSMPIAAAADATILVTRSTVSDLQPIPDRVRSLAGAGCALALATIGSSSYDNEELGHFAGCPVLVNIPSDPNALRWAAELLNGEVSRSARKSEWHRQIARLAHAYDRRAGSVQAGAGSVSATGVEAAA